MSKKQFGAFLKSLRIARGYGLRQFADAVGELPSNLSAVEHGRRNPPPTLAKLRNFAECLALVDGSPEWEQFFYLARQPGQLPAHVSKFSDSEIFPTLCRTLNDLQPTEQELKLLVEMLKKFRAEGRIPTGD